MFPPIFQLCAGDAGVKSALGSNPVRLYPFGQAPQGVVLPYAVWQIVSGGPENYLGNLPDVDSYTVQVDVYADGASSVRSAAKALRDAIEPHAHIVGWRGESRNPDTQRYRLSFDVDWFVHR